MMSLQAEILGAGNAICNEYLAHIVWLSCCWVAVDNVFQCARKDLAIRITCQTARGVCRENNDDWTRDIAGRIGIHPGIIIVVSIGGGGCGGELFRGRISSIVGLGGFLPLLDFFVALEVECFWHGDGYLVVEARVGIGGRK